MNNEDKKTENNINQNLNMHPEAVIDENDLPRSRRRSFGKSLIYIGWGTAVGFVLFNFFISLVWGIGTWGDAGTPFFVAAVNNTYLWLADIGILLVILGEIILYRSCKYYSGGKKDSKDTYLISTIIMSAVLIVIVFLETTSLFSAK